MTGVAVERGNVMPVLFFGDRAPPLSCEPIRGVYAEPVRFAQGKLREHPCSLPWYQNRLSSRAQRRDRMKTYYVYIMTNNSRTLYTGVTNSLERRVFEHKHKLLPGFTQKYNLNRLVYYESCGDIRSAIQREVRLKDGCVRRKSP